MLSRYIIHVDGDAFFVGVELASRPELRGKPVVTGHERGIATALSYEAKALGVVRGMSVFEIRKLFPQVIVLSSCYDDYLIYSQRLQHIVEQYVDKLEPYSIDECFAEIRTSESTIFEIGKKIKEEIFTKLGLTVSLGIAPTKVLAKIASKRNKPDGLTKIDNSNLEEILRSTKVGSLWGIGRELSSALRAHEIETAYALYEKPREWVYERFYKGVQEIYHELRGESVMKIQSDDTDAFKSIARSRTFRPSTTEKEMVYSELVHNLEEATLKARRFRVVPRQIFFFIKTQEFRYFRDELVLPHPTSYPPLILQALRRRFDRLFKEGYTYRASGVTLSSLCPEDKIADSLFEESPISKFKRINEAVDSLNLRFGENTLHLASSTPSVLKDGNIQEKPLCIPSLGIVK